MYRSKFKNLQIILSWFIINLLVSVAYALMVRVRLIEADKTSKKGGSSQ